jgi:magnesium-transporting ATPase (P-type)
MRARLTKIKSSEVVRFKQQQKKLQVQKDHRFSRWAMIIVIVAIILFILILRFFYKADWSEKGKHKFYNTPVMVR